jgi:DNA-binding transcriptional regulator/RsmH inhibitor MraZ
MDETPSVCIPTRFRTETKSKLERRLIATEKMKKNGVKIVRR